jgi:hypothetical protein
LKEYSERPLRYHIELQEITTISDK